jgi:hypothetical protein
MKRTFLMATSVLLAGVAIAQDKPAAERPRKTSVPLKLQVVYSRYQGEKRVSNVPYTLLFNSDERPVQLRMGATVPIQTMANNVVTVSYKDVGNHLDCNAESVDDGRFRLACSFEQSSVTSGDSERGLVGNVPLTSLAPVLRNFRSTANVSLRDGQSVQLTAATDPQTGDVMKIDLTLNVVK